MKHTAKEIADRIRDGDAIDRAIIATHRRVILRHRQLRMPLVIWRDGKVVEVSPDSIALPGDDVALQPPPAES
ncbi:MAG TPA: hypothetical protein VIH25_11410 [Steroidobacteraceae bacterium]